MGKAKRMAISTVESEERADNERRRFSWRTVFFGFTLSRRHKHRRDADSDVIFLDWHHPWLFFLAATLSRGTVFFIFSKMLMTAIGIFVLVFLAKAHFLNRFRTGLFLTAFFSAYACLVCYELVNLFHLM